MPQGVGGGDDDGGRRFIEDSEHVVSDPRLGRHPSAAAHRRCLPHTADCVTSAGVWMLMLRGAVLVIRFHTVVGRFHSGSCVDFSGAAKT